MTPKTLLISAAIAISFTAIPAHAQFGSGTSYDTPRQTQTTKAEKKAKKKAAMKRLEEAQAKKEAMERELKAKEQMAQQDDMKSYGSGTADDAMMKKDDAMMAKDDAMMKKDEMKSYGSGTAEDAMMKKDDGMMMKKDSMMSNSAMAPVGKPVNCPQGTTPQDNGTCLLTSGSLPIN